MCTHTQTWTKEIYALYIPACETTVPHSASSAGISILGATWSKKKRSFFFFFFSLRVLLLFQRVAGFLPIESQHVKYLSRHLRAQQRYVRTYVRVRQKAFDVLAAEMYVRTYVLPTAFPTVLSPPPLSPPIHHVLEDRCKNKREREKKKQEQKLNKKKKTREKGEEEEAKL